MPSIASLLQVFQLFYWSQMFTNVSMYWRIIVDSTFDTKYFMLMVFTMILSFTFSIYILDQVQKNLNKQEVSPFYEEDELQPDFLELNVDRTHFRFFDSFFSQYLLMLGEFDVNNAAQINDYPESVRYLIWIYFVAATFMTQVIFFNTLVAVICEAYNTRWGDRIMYAYKQRTQIYADYITLVTCNFADAKYMYVVQPDNQASSEDAASQEQDNGLKASIDDLQSQVQHQNAQQCEDTDKLNDRIDQLGVSI